MPGLEDRLAEVWKTGSESPEGVRRSPLGSEVACPPDHQTHPARGGNPNGPPSIATSASPTLAGDTGQTGNSGRLRAGVSRPSSSCGWNGRLPIRQGRRCFKAKFESIAPGLGSAGQSIDRYRGGSASITRPQSINETIQRQRGSKGTNSMHRCDVPQRFGPPLGGGELSARNEHLDINRKRCGVKF